MSRIVRTLALFAAAGLTAAGLWSGDDLSDGRWLVILGIVWLLILGVAWSMVPHSLPLPRRTTVRTGIALATVFAVLSFQLVRVQVVHQERTTERVATAPNGEIIANPRIQGDGLDQFRGAIFDRDGTVVAYSEEENGRYRRHYPEPAMASVVGYYSPLQYGTTGLEQAYDGVLSGEAATGLQSWFAREILGRPQTGGSVRLTVDVDLQAAAADLLAGSNGAVVLLDARTGAILAIVSTPTIDPNGLVAINGRETDDSERYWQAVGSDPDLPLIPRATVGLYAPGSTFKTVTAAAAIDAGTADPETIYEDDGDLDIDGRVLIENNRPDPTVDEWTLREGLMWSLNVVYAQVGLELGAEELERYAGAFGFGTELPIDLPSSESQLVRPGSSLDDPNALADTAFGQGELLVSPLHMALIASAFVNDGRIMRPYVAAETRDAEGRSVDHRTPAVWQTPISAESASDVREMMIAGVEAGLIQAAQIPGLIVGGKTGTAEVTDQRPHSWFIGFAGEQEPDVVVSVLLENGGRGQGSALDIGRQMLALAVGSEAWSGAEQEAALDRFSVAENGAYVRPHFEPTSLPPSPITGIIGHARNASGADRTTSPTTVRAPRRRCARSASRRCVGHARQR